MRATGATGRVLLSLRDDLEQVTGSFRCGTAACWDHWSVRLRRPWPGQTSSRPFGRGVAMAGTRTRWLGLVSIRAATSVTWSTAIRLSGPVRRFRWDPRG